MLLCDETRSIFCRTKDVERSLPPELNQKLKRITSLLWPQQTEHLSLHYYSSTRRAENIGKVLSDYSFKTLVTHRYSGYKTIIKNRNLNKSDTEQVRHQSFLVHLRRELLKVVLSSDLYKQLLDKPEEYVTQELQKQHLANTDGMKLHTALKAINAVFRIEAEKKAGLLNPEKARKAQAELIKYLDQMMLEASKGLVTQKGTT